jgi:hypothetical protein
MIGAKCSSNFEGSSSLLDMINKTRNDGNVAFKEIKIHTPFEIHAIFELRHKNGSTYAF